jgi:TolB protein
MMFKKWLSVIFTCVVFVGTARAQLVIEITSGADQLLPVAVVPFGYNGVDALPEDIAQIVESDLARSGLFQPIPRSNMLSMPSKESDVFYPHWRL